MPAVAGRPSASFTLAGCRAAVFSAVLVQNLASFQARRMRSRGRFAALDRARWLHDSSRLALRMVGIHVEASGAPPAEGLVVSNHLSYMDVLVYSSLFPCLFVSKQEVGRWPVFGAFATMAGTIYVDRDRSAENREAVSSMEQALGAGLPVVLFPEGTSSNGDAVLPFRSPFFEPAVRAGAVVTTAAIGYGSRSAAVREMAYYGDDVFGPHLLRTFAQRGLMARASFGATGCRYADRKLAARATQAEVERLREQMRQPGRPELVRAG